MTHGTRAFAALVTLSGMLWGCEGGSRQIDVTMVQAGTAATSFAATFDGGQGMVAASDVASLVVTVTDIQFLPAANQGAEDNGAWVSLKLGSPVDIDLAALPTEGDSPLVIASGTVEIGEYVNVRLFVSAATIRFNNALTIGSGGAFDADTDYPVTIPSAEQTGIKTNAGFSVVDEGRDNPPDAHLLFDAAATYLNVSTTGNGVVTLAPVLRSAS